jgi:hypothetical protein
LICLTLKTLEVMHRFYLSPNSTQTSPTVKFIAFKSSRSNTAVLRFALWFCTLHFTL